LSIVGIQKVAYIADTRLNVIVSTSGVDLKKMRNTFLSASIFVLVIGNLGNLFAYLTQFIAGRYLTVEDFGLYNSVNSIYAIFVSILAGLPFVISKYVIKTGHDWGTKKAMFVRFSQVTISSVFFVFIYLF